MEDAMNWINEIINITKAYRNLENPEISINGETNTIALYDYKKSAGRAVHLLDICPVRVVNLEELCKELNNQGITYTL